MARTNHNDIGGGSVRRSYLLFSFVAGIIGG
jgi:hypothetical protein